MSVNLAMHCFEFGPFAVNTYLLWHRQSLHCVIIDPGCWNDAERETLAEFVASNNLVPVALVNTHCHIDHIFGNKFVKDTWQLPLLVPRGDADLLAMGAKQAELFGFAFEGSPAADGFLDDLQHLAVGTVNGTLIHTPGHTAGEYCIYFSEAGWLIAGDVLFKHGIGRTDLWGGDYDTLINSIAGKLLTLPATTVVYPGHGPATTIGAELSGNPFLQDVR